MKKVFFLSFLTAPLVAALVGDLLPAFSFFCIFFLAIVSLYFLASNSSSFGVALHWLVFLPLLFSFSSLQLLNFISSPVFLRVYTLLLITSKTTTGPLQSVDLLSCIFFFAIVILYSFSCISPSLHKMPPKTTTGQRVRPIRVWSLPGLQTNWAVGDS